jgi:hypothetical protein
VGYKLRNVPTLEELVTQMLTTDVMYAEPRQWPKREEAVAETKPVKRRRTSWR